jgi:SOS-response transcriptional repressor LexA
MTIRKKGFAPWIPEVGQEFKIATTNGVSDHLKALVKKGYVLQVGKRAIIIPDDIGSERAVCTAVKGDSMINAGIFYGR